MARKVAWMLGLDQDFSAFYAQTRQEPKLEDVEKGVGSYAAASLLMLLGHYDFVPVDSWAYTVVSHEWYGGKAIGKAEVEAAFEQWGKWKGLVYWFWDWSYIDNG